MSKIKLVIFIYFVCSFVSTNCEYYKIWKPSFLAEFIANQSKVVTDHIEKETNTLSETITSYANKGREKQEMLAKEVKNLFADTNKKINDTFNEYMTSISIIGSKIQKHASPLDNSSDLKYKNQVELSLDTAQLIAMNGYNVETHTVVTDDGYILTLHRIPHAKGVLTGTSASQAVILQHGILSSSADFVTNGPKRGLAYVLSEDGYDVWLGNFRGSVYSRAHVKYIKTEAAFWNFTFHDIAMHDLPAMINYINAVKRSDKETLYIGHSMGTTALFALLSMKPEYNKKLKAAFCLAPVAYMTSLKSPLRLFAPFADSLGWIRDYLGVTEFTPKPALMDWLTLGCDSHYYKERICENIIFLLGGYNEAQIDRENLLTILNHAPAGASTKTVIHFAQIIRDKGRFQQFDYGPWENMKEYGQKIPPEYPIKKITLPIALFASQNDLMVGKSDSVKLYKDLLNPIEMYEVPDKDFTHSDFLWAVDAKTLLYDHLLKSMSKYKTDEGLLWYLNVNWNGK